MSVTTKPKDSRTANRLRSAELRKIARDNAAKKRKEAKDKADALREEADEMLAPAVQRNAVMTKAIDPETGKSVGVVLRAARVQRDGIAFIRASPLAWMVANIERAELLGTEVSFSRDHIKAAARLATAWDAIGEGVGLGASDWGSLRGSRGTAPMTPAGHSALVAQVAQRMEIEAARTWLGALWPCLFDIALGGMSPAAWAVKVKMDRKAGSGYLRAALDRLVEFYREREVEPKRRQKVRAVAVTERC